MATSELNNRLECLTSFSSQLVFVCNDKVKQQSQIVEDFIGQQNEETNLAILTANELTPLASYRETLFKQLISHEKTANFHLPLNQLLATLNEHDGPVLINIFQADKLPIKLVKEIWELVLQSRFAKNKQNLNVLLMGHSQWAEKIKNAVGSRSKDKPILLNGHSHNPHETSLRNIHEKAFSHKTSPFYDTPETHSYELTSNKPVYKKWWFISLISIVFLVTFSGLLYWLYPGKIEQMWINTPTQFKQIPEQAQTIEQPVIIEEAPIETGIPELPPQALEINELTDTVNKNTSMSDEVTIGSEILVTDWQTASDNIEIKNDVIIQANTELKEQPDSSIFSQVAAPLVVEETITGAITESDAFDYPVADIPVIEAFSIQPEQAALQANNQELQPSILTSDIDLFHIKDTSSALLSLPANRFVIQIAAMSNFPLLQEYASDKKLKEHVWLYKTQRFGGDWYVLLYNQDYPSIAQARRKINQLPSNMLDNVPFAKSMEQVQQEIPTS